VAGSPQAAHRQVRAAVSDPDCSWPAPGRPSGSGSAGAMSRVGGALREQRTSRRGGPESVLVCLAGGPRCLPVSAQVRHRCHSGRHGRRRVAGRSLSALISLRNGRLGERDVALRRAAR
jgi:hypothetical protein